MGMNRESYSELANSEKRLDKPRRCPDCGGLVDVIPCRACKVQRDLPKLRNARSPK